MSPADAGALTRFADELTDCRAIPLVAVAILQRLVMGMGWSGAPQGGQT
jgi:hypothetical protein